MSYQRYRAAIPYALCALLALLNYFPAGTEPLEPTAPYQLRQVEHSVTFKLPRISVTKAPNPPSVVATGAQIG